MARAGQVQREQRSRVLVVDDDGALCEALCEALEDQGLAARAAASSVQAAAHIRKGAYDLLVTDLRMPAVDGLELLALSKELHPERPVIVMTAFSAVDTAIESIRRGAHHYLTKPFKVSELLLFVDRALGEARQRAEAAALRQALHGEFSFGQVVGRSPSLREVCELLARASRSPITVLLLGETGTGKGVLARAIHAHSDRAEGPFVTVNCAAMPEALLESELFGHVRGAFTGAVQSRAGLVAEASGGTLFLDEVGEMPLTMQAKLLDVLERRVVRAVGSNREEAIDVRVVAATHRDLRALSASGGFREDLLYRLEGVAVHLPALRHRTADIPGLVEHFLELVRKRHPQVTATRVSAEAMRRLLEASWPGNVRELKNAIERGALLARGDEIGVGDLPALPRGASGEGAFSFGAEVVPLRRMQRRYAEWALERMGGRRMLTAQQLGIDPKTLARLLDDE